MEEVFVLSIGLIVGWSVKVIMSGSEVRKLRKLNRLFEKDNDDLRKSLKETDRLYRRGVEKLLDLRKRYDKIYSNRYDNKKLK